MAIGAKKFSNGDRQTERPQTRWADDLVNAEVDIAAF